MKKEDLIINERLYHKNRGLCSHTQDCFIMERSNPDSTSTFVNFCGFSDIEEVSLKLLTKEKDLI